jgi:serine/threonine protein kinase
VRTPVSDPQRVGPYRILGRLGSGGMGWVYLGRSPAGRAVAVKVVRPELAADQDFRQRFAREVEAARAVGGAFTAAVIEADTRSDPPWLATVYVPGPSLSEAIGMFGPFQETQVRRLGAGLVEALQAIHAAGVVHRDLKPANVLLAEDGPRVIDFGISLVGGTSNLTRTGIVMGTPSFMSPEQIAGVRVGPASDVFSLGGVLAFAATGRAPFGDEDGLMYRVLHEDPVLDAVPGGLREPIAQCLAKPPERRPTLETLLEGFMAAPAGGSGTPSWPPPAVAESIRVRADEVASRRSSGAGMSMQSCLLLHAQALLDAGLTDRMVVEAVPHGRT